MMSDLLFLRAKLFQIANTFEIFTREGKDKIVEKWYNNSTQINILGGYGLLGSLNKLRR